METPAWHARFPPQVVEQLSPEQVTAPAQLLVPSHWISETEALLRTWPLQAPSPHVTRHLPPEHWMGPAQALPAQVTVQFCANEQSTPDAHPPLPQSAVQDWSRGQVMALGQAPGARQSK